MIAVSGRCAGKKLQGRIACRARSMEQMMSECQFFEPRGVTCRYLRSLGSYRGCSSRPVLEWLDGE